MSIISTPTPIQTRMTQRITELQAEFAAGQKMLADLSTKQTELQGTLLRISGAIQVLTEILEMQGESAETDSVG